METRTLYTELIEADPELQPRAEINELVVNDYADDIERGEKLPPLVVFHDGHRYWLADGFHRYEALTARLDREEIECIVHEGTKRDAVLYSVGANRDHGLRRTNEDKRQAVTTLLKDEEWSKWSDREIAKRCGVSPDFVSKLHRSLSSDDSEKSDDPRQYTTKHGTQATMNTANIGKDQASREPTLDDLEYPDEESQDRAESEDSKPVLDGLGNAVTIPKVAAAFRQAKQLDDLRNRLHAWRREFFALLKNPAVGKEFVETHLKKSLDILRDEIKLRRPFTTCPRCQGDAEKCTGCAGFGWITKGQHKSFAKHSKD